MKLQVAIIFLVSIILASCAKAPNEPNRAANAGNAVPGQRGKH